MMWCAHVDLSLQIEPTKRNSQFFFLPLKTNSASLFLFALFMRSVFLLLPLSLVCLDDKLWCETQRTVYDVVTRIHRYVPKRHIQHSCMPTYIHSVSHRMIQKVEWAMQSIIRYNTSAPSFISFSGRVRFPSCCRRRRCCLRRRRRCCLRRYWRQKHIAQRKYHYKFSKAFTINLRFTSIIFVYIRVYGYCVETMNLHKPSHPHTRTKSKKQWRGTDTHIVYVRMQTNWKSVLHMDQVYIPYTPTMCVRSFCIIFICRCLPHKMIR